MIMVAGLSALRPATMLPIPGKKMLASRQKSPSPLVPTLGTPKVLPATPPSQSKTVRRPRQHQGVWRKNPLVPAQSQRPATSRPVVRMPHDKR